MTAYDADGQPDTGEPTTQTCRFAGTLGELDHRELASVAGRLVLPTVAIGLVRRRPRVMAATERLGTDRSAIATLKALHHRHRTDLVHATVGGRTFAVVLSRSAAASVLDHTPDPFSPAGSEKASALAQFQPHGVLISGSNARQLRRPLNEAILDTGTPMHSLAEAFHRVVAEEVGMLVGHARWQQELEWSMFATCWWRVVRRVVLGDQAREDEDVTRLLAALRARANWSFLAPRSPGKRRRLHERIGEHVDRAELGSLAGAIGARSPDEREELIAQVPHWLFAFDAAGIATVRALALIQQHPGERVRAVDEAWGAGPDAPEPLPFLRSCALESVRLWPTTPALLREATQSTTWGGDELPAGTTVLMYTPYLHRGLAHPETANRFVPDQWLDGSVQDDPVVVPFSAGPARCPGRDLVLLITSMVLRELLTSARLWLSRPHGLSTTKLPAGLNPFAVRFAVD